MLLRSGNSSLAEHVLPREKKWAYGYGRLSRAHTHSKSSSTFVNDREIVAVEIDDFVNFISVRREQLTMKSVSKNDSQASFHET